MAAKNVFFDYHFSHYLDFAFFKKPLKIAPFYDLQKALSFRLAISLIKSIYV
jgi:hypothetical protein